MNDIPLQARTLGQILDETVARCPERDALVYFNQGVRRSWRDFARCVDLCTRASLKEMVVPTLIAVGVPIAGGLLLGPAGVIGLLCGATASGFLLAVFMSNSGGSWDNAKKYVESGHYGGKGSKNDKSAIVGDTIGDPFKDTSGPAINILIKLLSMVSIVFATVVVNFHVFG